VPIPHATPLAWPEQALSPGHQPAGYSAVASRPIPGRVAPPPTIFPAGRALPAA